MKKLLVLLLCFFTASVNAEVLFSCNTSRGAIILEEMRGSYLFTVNATSCILNNKAIVPEYNRGQGYDSWEVSVGNDAKVCQYAIEYVDNGEQASYIVTRLDSTNHTQYVCIKDVVDHLSK